MSFGEELRRQRELRQISLREISDATKIDMNQLTALERNDFSRLPGGLYNRGYVRAYCDHIGIDQESMVNAYLLEERSHETNEPGGANGGLLRGRSARTTAAHLAAADSATERARRRIRRRVIALIAVGLLAAAALGGWWMLTRGGLADRASAASPATTGSRP